MRCSKSIGLCLLVVATGCSSPQGDFEVRAVSSAPKAEGLAEAEAQLAMGNVATALEGFRKVARQDPKNVAAALGIARSYDGMGRFDVSRRWYETALASAPDDPTVLGAFAASLELQGRAAEAASVRAEAAERAALDAAAERLVRNAADGGDEAVAEARPAWVPMTATVALDGAPAVAIRGADRRLAVPTADIVIPQEEPVVSAAPQRSVTVRLPPPAQPAPREVAAIAFSAPAPQKAGLRLERLSMGEVALITKAEPVWTAQVATSSSRSVTFRWVPAQPTARLLNAARNQGLAARTRAHLVDRGWRRIEIGDAPAVRTKTLVLYPAFRRATAQRLAAQFGFSELKPFNGSEIVVLLGRDAATMKALRPA